MSQSRKQYKVENICHVGSRINVIDLQSTLSILSDILSEEEIKDIFRLGFHTWSKVNKKYSIYEEFKSHRLSRASISGTIRFDLNNGCALNAIHSDNILESIMKYCSDEDIANLMSISTSFCYSVGKQPWFKSFSPNRYYIVQDTDVHQCLRNLNKFVNSETVKLWILPRKYTKCMKQIREFSQVKHIELIDKYERINESSLIDIKTFFDICETLISNNASCLKTLTIDQDLNFTNDHRNELIKFEFSELQSMELSFCTLTSNHVSPKLTSLNLTDCNVTKEFVDKLIKDRMSELCSLTFNGGSINNSALQNNNLSLPSLLHLCIDESIRYRALKNMIRAAPALKTLFFTISCDQFIQLPIITSITNLGRIQIIFKQRFINWYLVISKLFTLLCSNRSMNHANYNIKHIVISSFYGDQYIDPMLFFKEIKFRKCPCLHTIELSHFKIEFNSLESISRVLNNYPNYFWQLFPSLIFTSSFIAPPRDNLFFKRLESLMQCTKINLQLRFGINRINDKLAMKFVSNCCYFFDFVYKKKHWIQDLRTDEPKAILQIPHSIIKFERTRSLLTVYLQK